MSSNCDEILLWMIKLDENHLVSDSYCNIINLQGMTNNVGRTFSVGDAILQATISMEQDE